MITLWQSQVQISYDYFMAAPRLEIFGSAETLKKILQHKYFLENKM